MKSFLAKVCAAALLIGATPVHANVCMDLFKQSGKEGYKTRYLNFVEKSHKNKILKVIMELKENIAIVNELLIGVVSKGEKVEIRKIEAQMRVDLANNYFELMEKFEPHNQEIILKQVSEIYKDFFNFPEVKPKWASWYIAKLGEAELYFRRGKLTQAQNTVIELVVASESQVPNQSILKNLFDENPRVIISTTKKAIKLGNELVLRIANKQEF